MNVKRKEGILNITEMSGRLHESVTASVITVTLSGQVKLKKRGGGKELLPHGGNGLIEATRNFGYIDRGLFGRF